MFNILFTKRYLPIALTNILQQLISISCTIMLVKIYGTSEYSIYVLFITLCNTVVFFSNTFVNPFYIREGSKEYHESQKTSKTLSLILSGILIIFLILCFFNLFFEEQRLLSKYKYLIILFSISQLIFNISRVFYRISDNIKKYSTLVIFEKLLVLTSIVIIFIIYRNNLEKLFNLLTFFAIIISTIFLFDITKKNSFKFELGNKELTKNYINNSFYFLIGSIAVYFTNFDYLLIVSSLSSKNMEIIGYINIGILITNFIYMPIFWFEQLISPKLNIIMNSNNRSIKENYFNCVIYILGSITFIFQIFIFIILFQTDIFIYLLNEDFYKNKFYVLIFLFISINKSYDTLLSIPIFAIKLEKKIMYFNFIKLIIFLCFIYIYKNEFNNLIMAFLFLSTLQNFAYIFILKLQINWLKYIRHQLLILINLAILLFYFWGLAPTALLLSIFSIIFLLVQIFLMRRDFFLFFYNYLKF